MFQKISHRVAAWSAGVCAIAFIAVGSSTLYYYGKAELDMAASTASMQVQGAVDLLDYAHEELVSNGSRKMATLKAVHFKGFDGVSQVGKKDEFDMQQYRLENEIINGNESLLEKIKKEIGAEPAFLLLNEKGDLVRVATLLKDKEGKSMVGKPIDRESKEAVSIREGKAWTGVVIRSGKYYV
ncbi:MAG TPA: Cache 3/Cache 2 fusion domain-containing protein, partial [Ignavibacteriaceae bacterium]